MGYLFFGEGFVGGVGCEPASPEGAGLRVKE